MKIISSFLTCILMFIALNPSNSLDFSGILDISKLFNSMFVNPVELLFTLTKTQLKSMDTDFSCTLCQRVIKAVTSTIREKYGYEGIEYYAELLCSVALDRGVCNTYITKYGPVFIDTIILRAGNEENLCHKLGFCPEGEETEDTYDYAIRLLKDKPKNKKREGVDYSAPTLKMIQLTDIHLDTKYIENGTVYEISKPKKIDNYLYANIENFIFKNIPSLSENLYTSKDSKRNLEEKGITREYSKNDNTDTVNLKEIEKTSISFSDSKVNSETNFQINKEGHLNEINSFATIESISDSKKQIEDIPITGPFSNNDIDDEDQNIIQSPVLSVSNIITNKMNLESVLINENS